MKNISLLLVSTLLLAGSDARANEGGANREKNEADRFQEMKQSMLKDLEERIGSLQKVRGCISAAADHAAIKKCREEEEAARKTFFEARKQARIKNIEQRQRDLEKEKAELLSKEAKP